MLVKRRTFERGVCWSIMKTVWHYSSNCCEPPHLYLLDNAMFRWSLQTKRGRENYWMVLTEGKKATVHWFSYKQKLMLWYDKYECKQRKVQDIHVGSLRSKVTCTVLSSTQPFLWESSERQNFSLCPLLNDVIYDCEEGNVLKGHLKKTHQQRIK